VRQTLDDFVESYHTRNGLSRDRLTPEAVSAFDADMRAVVAPFCGEDDRVELHISATVTWGLPRSCSCPCSLAARKASSAGPQPRDATERSSSTCLLVLTE
jgi:hypothetical protein